MPLDQLKKGVLRLHYCVRYQLKKIFFLIEKKKQKNSDNISIKIYRDYLKIYIQNVNEVTRAEEEFFWSAMLCMVANEKMLNK